MVATGRLLCNLGSHSRLRPQYCGRSRMSASSPVPARPRRILMATDLSARCDRALDRAVQLSTQWQVPLQVVHAAPREAVGARSAADTLARSEEHTSELQSLMRISYAVFCLKKKKQRTRATP